MMTLTELLDTQEQNLDNMLTLLEQEFDLLKQRQALSLAEIATSKQQQLEAIVAGQASRASVGFEGSNKKTAEAVVDLYERLMNGEKFAEQNLFRPLLTIDAKNAAEYLADYK